MSDKISGFLDILETEANKNIKVSVSTKETISIQPLSFKQQKALVTSGLNGVAGVISFIKTINEIILYNCKEDKLKIYDRIPIILQLRNNISNKPVEKDDTKINISDLLSKFKKFDKEESVVIEGEGYNVHLRIPTLKQENKYLSSCIEELKKIDDENIGKNVSLILSYEIPKFIEKITYDAGEIKMEEISSSDRTKVMDSLPANVTNKIMDFILQVRAYDEELLSIDGVTLDIDHSLFE